MDNHSKIKALFKILIGVAWIDGIIQPEERVYLHRMAKNKEIAQDPEIKSLLTEVKQVSSQKCYDWLESYLGDNPTDEDYQELFNAIGALIYSDGVVDTEEAKLLHRLQLLDPAHKPHRWGLDKVLKEIQKLYRLAIKEETI